jgi:hypothetical protein
MSPKRVDANQSSIVAGLREFGASVVSTHMVGHGYPDINVGFRGVNYCFEIKDKGGKLTPAEVKWRDNWKGNYYVIHSIEEAIQILCDESED